MKNEEQSSEIYVVASDQVSWEDAQCTVCRKLAGNDYHGNKAKWSGMHQREIPQSHYNTRHDLTNHRLWGLVEW